MYDLIVTQKASERSERAFEIDARRYLEHVEGHLNTQRTVAPTTSKAT